MLVAQNTVNQTRVGICWEAIPGSEVQRRDMDRKAWVPNSIHPFASFALMFFQTAAVRLPALRMMGKAGLWFHIMIFLERDRNTWKQIKAMFYYTFTALHLRNLHMEAKLEEIISKMKTI